jgi:DNA-binding SARP family transcriptional activator
MSLQFTALGPVTACRGGEPVALGTRQSALLATLLLRAGEVVPVSRLIDDLWDEDPPETARNILQGYVSDLRKALGRDVVVTRGNGYSLHPPPGSFDLFRFEALIAKARDEDAAAAAATLRSALALWSGEPLANVAGAPFSHRAAARLEELRLLALERRIVADLELGRHRELVAELEAIVAEHPLNESFRAQLMTALYYAGRQADALATYREIRSLLVEELGIEPGPALRRLEQSILRHELPPVEPAERREQRSVLVAIREEDGLDDLIVLAERLSRPAKGLVLVWSVDRPDALEAATLLLHARREDLASRGVDARAASFVARDGARDLLRLATLQNADLVLVRGDVAAMTREPLRTVLTEAPCDVAVFVTRPMRPGPVLVPFVGARHDWVAVELGAWLSRAQRDKLILAGPVTEAGDSSLLLANASLAAQQALGVAVEPVLVEPDADALVRHADNAGVVVVGLPERWHREGIGDARRALAQRSVTPVVLVSGGLRPGGLAPAETLTRFTWSVG